MANSKKPALTVERQDEQRDMTGQANSPVISSITQYRKERQGRYTTCSLSEQSMQLAVGSYR